MADMARHAVKPSKFTSPSKKPASENGATPAPLPAAKNRPSPPASSVGGAQGERPTSSAERGRTKENGSLVHFGGSSWDVQQGVANRFRNENTDALNMSSTVQSVLSAPPAQFPYV